MHDTFLDQIIFGVYEVFANIIPGTILLLTIIFVLQKIDILMDIIPEVSLFFNDFYFIFFFFVAFIFGQGIQSVSSLFEKLINKIKYDGYPSEIYLNENDNTFPKYFKDNIRKKLNESFGTPIDSSSQHIFDLCYTYIIQKNISKRVVQFLHMYTFSRNMMATMLIEAIIFIILYLYNPSSFYAFIGVLSIIFICMFYQRFSRYAESFAKEVYKSYFIEVIFS